MKSSAFLIGLIFCCSLGYAQNEKWKILEVEADTLMAHNDYEGALKLYNDAIKSSHLKTQDSYIMLYKRSICLYSLEQFSEALIDVDDFVKLQPDFKEAKLLRAYIGRGLGDNNVQLSSLSDLLLLDPKNAELLKWRASVFIDDENYGAARNDIKVAKKIQTDAELETYLGISYYYQNQADSAILYFDKAILLDANYITSYLYAASLSIDEEVYDLALIYLNKALELDPASITIQFYKGIALVEKDDFTEGCRCLTKAFNAGVDDAGGYLKEFCYGQE